MGKVARASGVPRLVLTHLLPREDPEQLRAEVQKHYSGEIIIAEDLMSFTLS